MHLYQNILESTSSNNSKQIGNAHIAKQTMINTYLRRALFIRPILTGDLMHPNLSLCH